MGPVAAYNYCEEMGVVVPSGKGYCRCYPFSEEVEQRSKESVQQNAIQAQASGSKVLKWRSCI